jgi:hypothetical protein
MHAAAPRGKSRGAERGNYYWYFYVATNLKRGAQLIQRPVSMKSMNLWRQPPKNIERGAESELCAESNKVAKLWAAMVIGAKLFMDEPLCQLFICLERIHTSAANVLPSELHTDVADVFDDFYYTYQRVGIFPELWKLGNLEFINMPSGFYESDGNYEV